MTQFVASTPDFFDAYRHLGAARGSELQMLGISDPQARQQRLLAEERQLFEQSLKQGKSPAAIKYNLARSRGYRGRQATQPAMLPPPSAAARQIQHIQHGVSNSATLSGHGASADGGLSMQQLVNLPDDQFAEIVAKMGGPNSAKFKQAFGG